MNRKVTGTHCGEFSKKSVDRLMEAASVEIRRIVGVGGRVLDFQYVRIENVLKKPKTVIAIKVVAAMPE